MKFVVVKGQNRVSDRARKAVDSKIKSKWIELRQAPGQPKTPDLNGLKELKEGYYREYANGIIYFREDSQPFWVNGAILERYNALGGPDGDLGWPTADTTKYTEDGCFQNFQNTIIYWWPDTGAIQMSGSIAVTYKGLTCFGETDDDGLSSKDEPYVIFGAIPPPPLEPLTVRTRIYTDVDAGDSRDDSIELYRGLPMPVVITAALMEHDLSDPDKYKESVRECVEQVSKGAALAIGPIPVVGPFLPPQAESILKAVGPDLVEAINDGLRTRDDYIGTGTFMITAKQMVTLARAPKRNSKMIMWHLDSPLISGEGASYKVYVDIKVE